VRCRRTHQKVFEDCMTENRSILLEMRIEDEKYSFPTTISSALIDANSNLNEIDKQIEETIETVRSLTPNCDKIDYIGSAEKGRIVL